jgi:hypothetical protein
MHTKELIVRQIATLCLNKPRKEQDKIALLRVFGGFDDFDVYLSV